MTENNHSQFDICWRESDFAITISPDKVPCLVLAMYGDRILFDYLCTFLHFVWIHHFLWIAWWDPLIAPPTNGLRRAQPWAHPCRNTAWLAHLDPMRKAAFNISMLHCNHFGCIWIGIVLDSSNSRTPGNNRPLMKRLWFTRQCYFKTPPREGL